MTIPWLVRCPISGCQLTVQSSGNDVEQRESQSKIGQFSLRGYIRTMGDSVCRPSKASGNSPAHSFNSGIMTASWYFTADYFSATGPIWSTHGILIAGAIIYKYSLYARRGDTEPCHQEGCEREPQDQYVGNQGRPCKSPGD